MGHFFGDLVPLCVVGYYGDYFSVDCLLKGDRYAYRKKRPFFIQRLMQMQIGFTFFYTALHKITIEGNWLQANPIYYLMNYPPQGVTKNFILKDVLRDMPELCYWIGIGIIIAELAMIFLLFWRRTRVMAVILGCVSHLVLILTLDVPATFFFLFPAMFLLFINPDKVVQWIDGIRRKNKSSHCLRVIYDGQCRFCINSVKSLQVIDVFGALKFSNFQTTDNIKILHPNLTLSQAQRAMYVVDFRGNLYEGFFAFRRLAIVVPMLWPWLILLYLPGAGLIGPWVYKLIARFRYLF